MTELYTIPKRKVGVELWTPAAGSEAVRLFLGEYAETHGGVERPSDLFNAGRDFLAVETENGRIALIRSAHPWIVRILCADEEDAEAQLEGEEISARVAVELEDGTAMDAWVRYQLPDGRNRLQDFMNQELRFLPFHDDDLVLLVNRHRIARVRPI